VVPIGPTSNAAARTIDLTIPYAVSVTIEGTADLLFHRWQTEAVAEQAAAAKNSKAKKTDNVEAYVWRNADGELCLPGEYLRRSIVMAAKYKQDPRSPRKSAMDLVNASVISATDLASLGKTTWDFLDRRRVTIQRAGITRTRPGVAKGWRAQFFLSVLSPEYIDPAFLRDLISSAGRLVGVGDFRPTYGRFDTVAFDVTENL
jgi:hypothetical protein